MRIGLLKTPFCEGFMHLERRDMLAERLGVPGFSFEEMVRACGMKRTPLGREVDEYLISGPAARTPIPLAARVVADRLGEPDVATGFVLSGYPYTAQCARDLDAVLSKLGARLDRVLRFVVPVEVILQQWPVSVMSDKAGVRSEYRHHQHNADSVFEHYGDRATEIDAVGDEDLIRARALAALGLR
ncbi:nucleoside monophosphate kinase [Nocardia sp. NPDC088792]|uniref:nucleoside monophosphate kinase n=1 Tax=Nocardia sp. NPDC088792 TaxID=3364332 RepID=UPI0038274852